ncbi:MAG: hypothetical protein K8T10_04975 [Candidatus Eremiobacteraeota bacterium]|nr:hypothetical protein [Candidatus Eremiobacteraeota bacterium]
MMSQANFLERIIKKLESCGIKYMISGSLGSSFHGKPRATNDIDIVIDPDFHQLQTFIEIMGDDYYICPETAISALKKRTMFNIIDNITGWKADLIIRKNRPFSAEEFNRRIEADIIGVRANATTAEDTIIIKLEWARNAKSERQFNDALGVAVTRWESLDVEYMKKWAQELGIGKWLDKLLLEAQKNSLSKE